MRFAAILVFALLLALACVPAPAQSLQIIELKHRPAAQVLPVLQPLIEPGGSVSGSGFQLFVRAGPANLEQIRQVVASLDRAPRQLIIYAKQDTARLATRAGSEDRSVGNVDTAAQQVRAQEGVPAYVSSGAITPIDATTVTRTGKGVVVRQTVVPNEISSGFYVTPRVSGDTVFLDIGIQRETPGGRGPGSADTARISTTVSGKLGAWIELGGSATGAAADARDGGSALSSTDASARSVYVRVEEAR